MGFVAHSDRPVCRRCYTVAGRLLFVQLFDHRLVSLMDQLFAGWLLTTVKDISGPPQLVLRCLSERPFPVVSSSFESFDMAKRGRCYLDDHSLIVDLETSFIRLSS